MRSKKKSPSTYSQERLSVAHSIKKSSHKHSRQPTTEPPALHELINIKFRKSKQLHDNQVLLHQVNSLIFGMSGYI